MGVERDVYSDGGEDTGGTLPIGRGRMVLKRKEGRATTLSGDKRQASFQITVSASERK